MVFFRPLRAKRLAISVLPSVVSDGSPGSCAFPAPFVTFSCVDDRNLFGGGLPFLG